MQYQKYNKNIQETTFQSPDLVLEVQPHNKAFFLYPITANLTKGPSMGKDEKESKLIQVAVKEIVDGVHIEDEYITSRNKTDAFQNCTKAMEYFFTLCNTFTVGIANELPYIEFRSGSFDAANETIQNILRQTRPIAEIVDRITAEKED